MTISGRIEASMHHSTPTPTPLASVDLPSDLELLGEAFSLIRSPLTYSAFVIQRTSHCNAKCAMCYQAAGPKGSELLGSATLSVAALEPVIRDAVQLDCLQPKFHLGGGETLLDEDATFELLAMAKRAGFVEVRAVTNAFWARKTERARAVCERLRAAGLTKMEISWDAWHASFIPAEAVSNCIDACAETGIDSCVRILTARGHTAAEALSTLRPESLAAATMIQVAPVTPTGRAAKTIAPEDAYPSGTLHDTCFKILTLAVNPLGHVSPCCAGFDQTGTLSFGNILEEPILTIVERMNRSALLQSLVHGGPASLVPLLRARGIDVELDHTNICHLCWDIFSRPERVRALLSPRSSTTEGGGACRLH